MANTKFDPIFSIKPFWVLIISNNRTGLQEFSGIKTGVIFYNLQYFPGNPEFLASYEE